jgi:hypothetical protein
MSPDLQNLIHNRQHGVLGLLIWYAITVVKDYAALLELLDIEGVFVETAVYLDSLGLDAV